MPRLVALALLLTLTTCGGDPSPTPTASPTAASSTPSGATTAAPTGPPTMPSIAEDLTPAGAEAFVAYFWEMVNYAQRTLDTAPLKQLYTEACAPCASGVASIEQASKKSGRFDGGVSTTSDVKVTSFRHLPGVIAATVGATVDTTALTTTYPGKKPEHTEAIHARYRIIVLSEPGGWRFDSVRAVS